MDIKPPGYDVSVDASVNGASLKKDVSYQMYIQYPVEALYFDHMMSSKLLSGGEFRMASPINPFYCIAPADTDPSLDILKNMTSSKFFTLVIEEKDRDVLVNLLDVYTSSKHWQSLDYPTTCLRLVQRYKYNTIKKVVQTDKGVPRILLVRVNASKFRHFCIHAFIGPPSKETKYSMDATFKKTNIINYIGFTDPVTGKVMEHFQAVAPPEVCRIIEGDKKPKYYKRNRYDCPTIRFIFRSNNLEQLKELMKHYLNMQIPGAGPKCEQFATYICRDSLEELWRSEEWDRVVVTYGDVWTAASPEVEFYKKDSG